VSEIVTSLGLGFGTTSYPHNGLNGPEAVASIHALKQTFNAIYGPLPPGVRTYLVGVSQGGMIGALAAEEVTDDYQGVLAACGPVGDFRSQINYFGDFRVLFDYFFPGVLPGSAAESPAELRANWESVYVPAVLAALQNDPLATAQLLSVTDAPVELLEPETIGQTVIGLLWYTVFSTEDAQERLGGQPYDNSSREYSGSADDLSLNAGVARFSADLTAREALGRFETTGMLARPLVTLHTDGDPIVPVVHQSIYADKVEAAGAEALLDTRPVSRYGHCTFQQEELLSAFGDLVASATP
jgi:pimeloyl-ACP methyl ester carboxylesterase